MRNSIFDVRIDNISFDEILMRVAKSVKESAIDADISKGHTDGQNKADRVATKLRSETYFQYVAATRRGSNEGMRNYVRLYKLTIMYLNIHVLNSLYNSSYIKKCVNGADIIYCDGFGVKLAGLLSCVPTGQRATGASFIYKLCEFLEREKIPIYILAAENDALLKAILQLKSDYPDLNIAGYHHGYFEKSDEVIDHINSSKAAILLVGLGSPKQEIWVSLNRDRINANVIWCVGALFDYVARKEKRGPKILVDNGFEWLFRLYQNPQKMWKRYLVGIPLFYVRVLKELVLNCRNSFILR